MSLFKQPRCVRIASCFRNPVLRGYSLGKLLTDPVYAAVFDRVLSTEVPLLDLGCGIGLCPFYLRDRGYRGPMLGVDSDGRKIKAAQRASARHGLGVEFRLADAADPTVLEAQRHRPGHVLMLDVLHYFQPEAQARVLTHIAQTVGPGGCAILRVTPADDSRRFKVSKAEEWVTQRIGWMASPPEHFPTIEQVATPFQVLGFSCDSGPLWGRTPFNSYLFAFTRP